MWTVVFFNVTLTFSVYTSVCVCVRAHFFLQLIISNENDETRTDSPTEQLK